MSEENLSAKDVEAARSFATIRNDQFLGTAPNPSWEAERKAFLAGISHARAQMAITARLSCTRWMLFSKRKIEVTGEP